MHYSLHFHWVRIVIWISKIASPLRRRFRTRTTTSWEKNGNVCKNYAKHADFFAAPTASSRRRNRLVRSIRVFISLVISISSDYIQLWNSGLHVAKIPKFLKRSLLKPSSMMVEHWSSMYPYWTPMVKMSATMNIKSPWVIVWFGSGVGIWSYSNISCLSWGVPFK